jgi:outer membrane protein OmpA-like peptidoglycan-associated protein
MIPFASGSVRLDGSDLSQIADVAASFRRAPRGTRVRLSAGMDHVGSRTANRRMAQRRGEIVRAALVRRGIPAQAIEIEIYSPARASGMGRVVQIHMVESRSGCG